MKKFLTLFIISLFMLVSCNGDNTSTPQGSTHTGLMDARLQSVNSLEIEPSADVFIAGYIPVGLKVPFSAQAFYADGTKDPEDYTHKVVWTNEDSSNSATIDQTTGELQALAPGQAVISAHGINSSVQSRQTIQITNDLIDSIAIQNPDIPNNVLPIDTTEQLQAVGIFQSNNTFDVTNSVTWTSNNPSVIEVVDNINSPGLIKALTGSGSATITATWSVNGLQRSAQVVINASNAVLKSIKIQSDGVNDDNSIPVGVTKQYKAYGYYSDGHIYDLTDVVHWPQPTAVTQVNMGKHGLITTLASGQVMISASYADKVDHLPIYIDKEDAAIIHIELNSKLNQKAILTSGTVKLQAVGIFEPSGKTYPLSDRVAWKPIDSTFLKISSAKNNPGLVTGLKASNGQPVNIYATYRNRKGIVLTSNVYPLIVLPKTLANMQLTPSNQLVYKNIDQQYLALGYSPDGYQLGLNYMASWRVLPTNIAAIGDKYTNKGILTPKANNGTGSITAIIPTLRESAQTNFTISTTHVVSITVNGAPESVAKGVAIVLTAQATLNDLTTIDITNSTLTAWTSDHPDRIAYSNIPGKFIALATGSAKLTATFSNPYTNKPESASVDVMVNDGVITGLTVSPVTSNMPINGTKQFIATVVDSAGNTYPTDDFGLVTWSSGDSAVGIDPVTGLATSGAVAKNNITITAKLNNNLGLNISGQAKVNVVAAILKGINILPHTANLAIGGSINYTAEAIYANPAIIEPLVAPTQVKWTLENNPAIAKIDAYGRLVTTGTGAGPVTVDAQLITNGKLDPRPEATAKIKLTIIESSADQFESLEIRSDDSGDLAVGDSRHYNVIAHYKNHDEAPVNINNLSWSSSKESVATINSIPGSDDFGVAVAKAQGDTVITAVLAPYTNFPAHVALHVNANLKMESIEIVGSHNAAIGDVRSYQAYGAYYVNGQLVDPRRDITKEVSWTIVSHSVGGFGSGDKSNQLTILGQGNTNIIAAYNNESATFALSVLPNSHIESLVISSSGDDTVKRGQTKQYILMAYYNNIPSYNATNDAIWSTESLTVADIDSHGKLTAIGIGKTNVVANYASESTRKLVHVVDSTPANVLDGAWLVDTLTGHQYKTNESLTLNYKGTRSFKLIAHYKDGTTQAIPSNLVDWISTESAKVLFNNGVAKALESNVSVVIYAHYKEGVVTKETPKLTVVVPAVALSKVVINNAPESVAASSTYTFSATGYFGPSDTTGTNPLVQGVKWKSSDTSKINFDDSTNGKASISANVSGPVTISVVSLLDNRVESHITVNIVNGPSATLKSISIDPSNYTFIQAGDTKQYRLKAHYVESGLDGYIPQDEVRWHSDNESHIAIDEVTGVATAISPGTANITAFYKTESVTTQAHFSIETITDVSVLPVGGIHIYSVGFSEKANLVLITESHGKLYVGSSPDTSWLASDPSKITITPGKNPSDPVTITAKKVGTTDIAVTYHGQIRHLSVTVEAYSLWSMSLLPVESMTIGIESLPQYYQVMGYFIGDSSRVLHHELITGTTGLTLIPTNPAFVKVDSKDGTLTGLAQGSTTVTAKYGTITAHADVIVKPSVKLESLMVLPRVETTVGNNLVCYVVLARVGNQVINVTRAATIDAGSAAQQITGASCKDNNSDLEGVYVKIANQVTATPVPVKVSYANMTTTAGKLSVVALDTIGSININPTDSDAVSGGMHKGTYQILRALDDQNNDISGLVKWTTSESSNLRVDANGLLYVPESASDVADGVTITASYAGLTSATYAQPVSTVKYAVDQPLTMSISLANEDLIGDAIHLHTGNRAYVQVTANYADGTTQDVTDYATVLSRNVAAIGFNQLTHFVTALSPVAIPVDFSTWYYDQASSNSINSANSGLVVDSNKIANNTQSIIGTPNTDLPSGVSTHYSLQSSYVGEEGYFDQTYDGVWQAGVCNNATDCGIDIIPIGRYTGSAIAYGNNSGNVNVSVSGFNPADKAQTVSKSISVQ